jgi:hypothetical protein
MGISRSATIRTLVLLGLPAAAAAGSPDHQPLFESDAPAAIELRAPLYSLSRDRSASPAYRDATLVFAERDGARRELPIRLRPRGKSRRDPNACSFPPLSVKLPTADLAGTLFEGQDRLKLTTYCRPNVRHQRYLFKEYLAYRLLNLVSATSFRVKAVEVTYTDLDRNRGSEPRFGFFLEDAELLSARLGLGPGPERVHPSQLEPGHASLMELFQLMIGNTDFSFVALPANKPCCHNAVVREGANGQYLPLPYDFDGSGFVNAPYAQPHERLPIKTVRQRLYRGFCRDGDALQRAVARMQEIRPAVFDLLQRETPLDAASRKEAIAFIAGFYDILDAPKKFDRQVRRACLNSPNALSGSTPASPPAGPAPRAPRAASAA